MGRQVNFRVFIEDVELLETALLERGPVILPWRHPSETFPELPSIFNEAEWGGGVYLARPEDLDLIRTEFIPQQNYWVLDDTHSPVVDVLVSPPRIEGEPGSGRLYYMTGYWDENDQPVWYPKDFIAWADGLLRIVRLGLFIYDKKVGIYDGPAAHEWFKTNKLTPIKRPKGFAGSGILRPPDST